MDRTGPPYIVGMLLIYCYQKLLLLNGQNKLGTGGRGVLTCQQSQCTVVCCLLFRKCGSSSEISILPIKLLKFIFKSIPHKMIWIEYYLIKYAQPIDFFLHLIQNILPLWITRMIILHHLHSKQTEFLN